MRNDSVTAGHGTVAGIEGLDRYEMTGAVEAGGAGQVRRARDRMTGQVVAVKRLPSGRARDIELRALRVGGAHPALTPVVDAFDHEGSSYLVTVWIEGPALSDLAKEPAGFGDVVRWIERVAAGLDHLHARGLVHRDVKPSNIVADDRGAVLVDLGAALGPARAGTPGFRAPEVARGEAATPASDVYGLAASAYAVLEGAAPVPGARPTLPTVPARLRERVRDCLQIGLSIDPGERHRSAGAFAAALAPPAAPTNLPVDRPRFFGRTRERDELSRALTPGSLITIVAPGGSGKTALALEVARDALADTPGGVWVIGLERVSEARAVPDAIAAGTGVVVRGRDPLAAAATALAGSRALLVLDNCEHVVDAAARAAGTVLASCPELTILATSRQPLDAGATYALAPLPVPDEREGAEATAIASVAMFLDRARAADPGFAPDAAQMRAVARICRQADGFPLAIELAAARVASDPVGAIADELDAQVGPAGTAVQPMRRAIDWSVERLRHGDRVTLRSLSLFAGFDPASAARAISDDPEEARAATERLRRAGLLAGTAGTRLRMLEPVRAVAEAALTADPGREALIERFLAHHVEMAETAAGALGGPADHEGMEVLLAERPNLLRTLEMLLATGDAGRAARMILALEGFIYRAGGFVAALPLVERCLSLLPDDAREVRARLTMMRAASLLDAGEHEEGLRAVDEAEALAGGDRSSAGVIATASMHRGYAAMTRGRFEEGREHFARGLAAAREARSRRREASLLANLATLELIAGRIDASIGLHEQALGLYQQMGDRRGVVGVLTTFSQTVPDAARARTLAAEAVEGARAIGDVRNEAFALQMLAMLDQREGDGVLALARHAEALELHWGRRDADGVTKAMYYIAECLTRTDPVRAIRLTACHAAIRRARGFPVVTEGEDGYRALLDTLRVAVGAEVFERAWQEGASMAIRDGVRIALGS